MDLCAALGIWQAGQAPGPVSYPCWETGLNLRESQTGALPQLCIEWRPSIGQVVLPEKTYDTPVDIVQLGQTVLTGQDFREPLGPGLGMHQEPLFVESDFGTVYLVCRRLLEKNKLTLR